MKLVEPDYSAIAWAAQARWLWERTPEAHAAFDRAMQALLKNACRYRQPNMNGGI